MKNKLRQPSIWLLIILVGFPQISETIYTPSLPQLAETIHTSEKLIQQTLSIYFAGFATGVLIWGILSDIVGRRVAILLGVLLYITGSFACLFANDIILLLIARFIQAVGAACGSVVTQTIIRDIYDDQIRPSVFAKIATALAFTPALGPLIGGALGQFTGIKGVFAFLVILGFSIEVITLVTLPETMIIIEHKQSIKFIFQKMLTNRNVWLYGTLIGMINGALFSYYEEAPFVFIHHFHFTESEYGCIGLAIGAGTFSGAWYSNTRLNRKNSPQAIIRLGFFIMLSGALLFNVVMGVHRPLFITIPLLLISIFIIMLGIAVALPHCLSNALINFKEYLGQAGALLGLYYYMLVGAMTLAMSYFHNCSPCVLPLFITVTSLSMLLISKALK